MRFQPSDDQASLSPSRNSAEVQPGHAAETPADTIPGTIGTSNPLVAPGSSGFGYVSGPNDVDTFRMEVVAGQTYLIEIRGAGTDPISDPLLKVYNSSGAQTGLEDDGGHQLAALHSYTATYTGSIYLGATAYWDHGSYQLKVVAQGADEDQGGRAQLPAGTTAYGFLTSGDSDSYAVYLEAGRYYQFDVSGGADYETEKGNVPVGELDTVVTLSDEAGNQIATNDDGDPEVDLGSSVGILVENSGYYTLNVGAKAGQSGGYSIDTASYDLSQVSPLDAIDWGTKVPNPQNITVYFAKAGETFGSFTSLGFTAYEIQQVMLAFRQYENVLNIKVSITDNPQGATFKLNTVSDPEAEYFGIMSPPGGTGSGIGAFNIHEGWDRDGPSVGTSWNGTLEPGGNAFQMVLHELGHGLGLAHPHDNGGGSSVLLGVTGGFSSLGLFDLNQGVYTTMSYNSGWTNSPAGPQTNAAYGFEFTASPLDIAVLQTKYGSIARNAGPTEYQLDATNDLRTGYETIWDTGGVDTIVSGSNKASVIDLTAATLDYSRTGGGVVSYVAGVLGGFTIAAGVVIENATGGSGSDTIVGNQAANFIDLSRGGIDSAFGKGGRDAFYVGGALTLEDRIDGGADDDQLGLQGNYAGLILNGETLRSVETVALLSGSETRFNNSLSGFDRFSYAISTADSLVAAGQQLTIQGGLLLAGEDLSFNGEAETDGTFLTYGGVGRDMITGGQRDDGFYFGEGAFSAGDRVVGSGGGNDQLALRGDYSAGLVFAADAIAGVETLVFLSARDVRFGAAGSDFQYNVTFDDGNVVAGANFTVNGTSLGEAETITFDGSRESNGSFRILGGAASDQLTGGAGADQIYGGLGGDTLAGGAGGDTFLYRSLAESTSAAADRILLFDSADLIDLSQIDANAAAPGNDAFSFIGADAFGGIAGQLRAYQEGGNWIVAGDANGDGVADILISLTTAAGVTIGADDFLL